MTSYQLPDSAEMLQFRKNEKAVSHLASLLSDPVMQRAFALVSDLSKPTQLPETTPGVHPDTCVAHHHHLQMGLNLAITKIKKLALPILPGDPELDDRDREEFEDHLPPELRRK